MRDKTDFFRQSNNELGMRNFYYSEQHIDKPYSMPHPHIHNQHELYFLMEGERRYTIGSKILHIHAGDIVYIPKNTIHRTNMLSQTGHSRILVNFSDEYMSNSLHGEFDRLFQNSVLSLDKDSAEKVCDLMRAIGDEYFSHHDRYSLSALKSRIDYLIITLLRITHSGAKKKDDRHDSFIESAVSYINSNFDMPLTLSEVAKHSAMSKSHFSKRFREETGMSFGEYLHMTRILNAQRLLHDTDMSVTQIASVCGFSNSSYFSTEFRKKTGMTPLNFRKNSKKTDMRGEQT